MRVFLNGLFLILSLAAGFHALIALWPAVDPLDPPDLAAPAATSEGAAGEPQDASLSATPEPDATEGADGAADPDDFSSAPEPAQVGFFFNVVTWDPSIASALLALVAIAGALGSLLHTANSFAVHVARRDFDKSWQWWYILRPLIGAGLALVTYLLVRGQLLGLSGPSEELNPYGVAGIAALVGLFSRQAMVKLGEVADTLFADDRPPTPSIERVEPAEISPGSQAEVKVSGRGFVQGLDVTIDGNEVPSSDVTSSSLKITVPQSYATVGDHIIVVTNPSGASATTRQLTVK